MEKYAESREKKYRWTQYSMLPTYEYIGLINEHGVHTILMTEYHAPKM